MPIGGEKKDISAFKLDYSRVDVVCVQGPCVLCYNPPVANCARLQVSFLWEETDKSIQVVGA